MNSDNDTKWGIIVDTMMDGMWSFGVCLSVAKPFGEAYIFINLFKWSISIGKVEK